MRSSTTTADCARCSPRTGKPSSMSTATLDRELTIAATSEIIRAANTRRPANTSIGEPAIIRREGMKQKRHIPVRDLIERARTTCMAIKPVFMMSPLAVSQYLPSDMTFDVVIFDEASQVTPGDAINCIYRGKALILAGDDKQLPPTSFFDRQTDDENDDTDVDDFQSVLELAKACGAFNNLGLRWHYRSRHEGLIAFSNYKFYEGKLITYPSAHAEGDHVGVAFYNAHGTYRRGGGADNPGEAAKVAERVIEHYTTRPDLTLGVVTFSVAQADAVVAAVSEAREQRRDLDHFFDTEDRLNGFFVRSLESVQGDERDVIIFSVGYGPDEAGKISTNFGVLNRDKGWRRLNVGITRARQRVEVVASMRAGDIPPSTNENVEYLRSYLDYADRGMTTLAVPVLQHRPRPRLPVRGVRHRSRSAAGAIRSNPRSAPPGSASTSACVTPPTPACSHSASNATATSTTPPPQHATATGCATRSWSASAGVCTASGAPPGTATAAPKRPACVAPSRKRSPRPSTAASKQAHASNDPRSPQRPPNTAASPRGSPTTRPPHPSGCPTGSSPANQATTCTWSTPSSPSPPTKAPSTSTSSTTASATGGTSDASPTASATTSTSPSNAPRSSAKATSSTSPTDRSMPCAHPNTPGQPQGRTHPHRRDRPRRRTARP